MNASIRWPSDDELVQLLSGELNSARQAEIEALLENDEPLRRHLERLAGGASWIGRAGGSSGGAPSPDDADSDFALQAAIVGLKRQASSATVVQGLPRGPVKRTWCKTCSPRARVSMP